MTTEKEKKIEKKITKLIKKLSKKEQKEYIEWLKFDTSWKGY